MVVIYETMNNHKLLGITFSLVYAGGDQAERHPDGIFLYIFSLYLFCPINLSGPAGVQSL